MAEPTSVEAFSNSTLSFPPAARLCVPQGPLSCLEHVIDVWAFDLQAEDACLDACRSWLSQDETRRANRFVFERDRRYFTVAHGTLRCVLARYLGEPPSALVFDVSPAGKPRLTRASAAASHLAFNLSHSGGRALLAVGTCELGIDLERIRSDVAAREIASSYFAPGEQAAIAAHTDTDLADVFFRYWVAKEAVLKAQGTGLGFDLHRFSVEFDPTHTGATVSSLDPQLLSPEWQIRMLSAGAGWAAAVCARDNHWRLRCRSPAES